MLWTLIAADCPAWQHGGNAVDPAVMDRRDGCMCVVLIRHVILSPVPNLLWQPGSLPAWPEIAMCKDVRSAPGGEISDRTDLLQAA
eukprot:365811-Chlamydomonas_euryale.AAC.12